MPQHGHKTHLRCVQIGKDERYTTLELEPEDAHLIAVAPKLLEALMNVVIQIQNQRTGYGEAGITKFIEIAERSAKAAISEAIKRE